MMSSQSPTHSPAVRNTSPLRNASSALYNSYDTQEPSRSSNEYHSNYHNESDYSTPPVTLISRKTENDYTRQARRHQRSLTELLPQFPTFKSPNSRSPSRSPIKEISHAEYEDEFMATLTGDRDNIIKVADKTRGGLSSWFSGSSAPVQVGISTENNVQPGTPEKLFKRPTSIQLDTGMRENTSPRTPDLTTTLMNFSNKFFSPMAKKGNMQHINDELLNLDIQKALFPAGRNENDPFSPSSFHNLLQNAEGLLQKMQSALQTRTQALSDLTAEKSAKDEEFEEAEIRAKSLKSQLDEMAAQIAEKEKLNTELVQALATEKNLRREEARAREKSIALVRAQAAEHEARGLEDEDLDFPGRPSSATPKKGNRISSSSSSSISGDEEEVFSSSTSPRLSTSTFTTLSSVTSSHHTQGEILEATPARIMPHPNQNQNPQRPQSITRQRSTFQKILHGDEEGQNAEGKGSKLGLGQMKCSNCEGRDAGFAWDTVGVLRAENKGLKDQVQKYQEGIDGALNAVLGIGMYAS